MAVRPIAMVSAIERKRKVIGVISLVELRMKKRQIIHKLFIRL